MSNNGVTTSRRHSAAQVRDAISRVALQRVAARDPLPMEQFYDGDHFVVRLEAPAVDSEAGLSVSLLRGRLYVEVTRTPDAAHAALPSWHSELRYGSFSRTIDLPRGAYENEVRAHYARGVLEIRVPFAVVAPRQLTIELG
jgi:HSP20 family molecular chaperone IbpA